MKNCISACYARSGYGALMLINSLIAMAVLGIATMVGGLVFSGLETATVRQYSICAPFRSHWRLTRGPAG